MPPALPARQLGAPGLDPAMFDRIAPVYDLMNTVMTAGLDALAHAAVIAAGCGRGDRALDVACGTGRLTGAWPEPCGASGEAVGVDAPGACSGARRPGLHARTGTDPRLSGRRRAGPSLDAAFDAVTIAFGLRNLPDYAAGLAEMARLVRRARGSSMLEIAEPGAGHRPILFRTWFRRWCRSSAGWRAGFRLPVPAASLAPYPDRLRASRR